MSSVEPHHRIINPAYFFLVMLFPGYCHLRTNPRDSHKDHAEQPQKHAQQDVQARGKKWTRVDDSTIAQTCRPWKR